jgi:uncharacterized membrane protein
MMTPWVLAGTTFLASAVEFVEAATIVLAVAVTQGYRIAVGGTVAAMLVLAVIVGVFTPILTNALSLERLELVVGPFLILFGIAWLRKAVWRYAGRKALRDEATAFRREVDHLSSQKEAGHGFAVAFQGVFVEGLEVAVIVVTFAASTPALVAWSAGGALAAFAVVSAAAIALRAPFSRVPENLLKSVVGVMLLSLGTLWTGDGAHLRWWLGDATLFAFIGGYLVLALGLIGIQRRVVASNR